MLTHIKETSKSASLALCEGNSPVTAEFPAQRASDAEKFPFDDVIVSWRGQHSNADVSWTQSLANWMPPLKPAELARIKPKLKLDIVSISWVSIEEKWRHPWFWWYTYTYLLFNAPRLRYTVGNLFWPFYPGATSKMFRFDGFES